MATRHGIFTVDLEVTSLGGLYVRQYGPTHASGIIDCLLAANAEIKGCRLVTHNLKHFPMLGNILVPYEKTVQA